MASSLASSAAAARPIIYLGLDAHKESITIAVLPDAAPGPTRVDRLPNELPKTFQREILKSRHSILELLARRGFVFREGTNWCMPHLQ